MTEKQKKIVGYGINISHKDTSFERVATFNDENVAKAFYHSLESSEEVKLGAKIDLEKIYEVNGEYEYKVMLKNYKPTIKVTIEEHISETFEIEAADIEEAMQLAEERYYSGEYVLGSEASVTARLMSADDGNGDCTEWTEF
jgi:hypothetical protein